MESVLARFFLIVVSILAWQPARGQWSTDPNLNISICSAANNQKSPTIGSDGAGGAIIAWYDYRGDTLYPDIYAQRVSESGLVRWITNGVRVTTLTSGLWGPDITSDGAGGAIITWEDYRTSDYDIYAQRVNASGAMQWTTNGVVLARTGYYEYDPRIVSDGAGGAIVAWFDSPYSDVRAQKINASGLVQWTTNGVAISVAAGDQWLPGIVSDGAGGAIITWQDDRNGSTNSDIYAQRVNASGVVQWTTNGVPISAAANNQQFPTITTDGGGGAIITWQDDHNGSANYDIYAQRVNDSGVVQWTTNGISIATAPGDQKYPTILSDAAGGAIITWDDNRNGSTNYDIYAQKVSTSGVVQWTTNGVPISTAANNQQSPRIAIDGTGGAIITWDDNRDGSTSYDIYAQKVNASGVVQWTTDGVPISTAAHNQINPAIASNAAGGAIITWVDYRTGTNSDIHAQQISASGQLGVATEVQDNGGALPESFRLEQNYPNPFNPSTTIRYQLPTESHVTLTVFDVLGREVATLANAVEGPGYKSVNLNALGLASGIYYYRLQVRPADGRQLVTGQTALKVVHGSWSEEASNYSETKKLLLIR